MQHNLSDTFLQEAADLLSEIETIALDVQSGQNNEEAVNHLFRAFHTIKGSGAMFGFDAAAGFTHHVETVLDKVRDGALPLSTELIGLVLAAKDHIRILLDAGNSPSPADSAASAELIAKLQGLTGTEADAAPPNAAAKPVECREKTWTIRFRPDPKLLDYGGNPALLFRDLRNLGECRIEAHTDRVPALEEMQPNVCYIWWTIELRTTADLNAIRDVFLFVEDGAELHVEAAAEEPVEATPAGAAPEDTEKPAQAPAAGAAKPDWRSKTIAREASVRVPSEKLDRLVGLVGELVMNQSRLSQAVAQAAGAAELAAPVEEIERLVAELRDDVLGIRMMPIGTIFGRFRRLVHDLSAELGKDIDLVMEGAETELDKSILDQLGEPLVHLLRNSLDHGVEPAAQRLEAGKPARATIRLRAEHRGSDVVVSVEDDGRGLDRAAIRAKAIERQVIAPDANLSDKEVLNLILLPGFSTAREVTSVSGRGVGMDVVKKQIDALRGSLSIASEQGKGARFALTLPLTLAIIDGLLVQVDRDQFIIPMAAVTENVELRKSERQRNNGRNLTAVRGELVPYVDLREAFRTDGESPAISKIVIVHHEDQRVGLVVDRVLGTHQTVIQSLGRFFRNIDVVSGATIMGDGRVALILDIPAVVRHSELQTNASPAAALR